jgi:DNA-binding XRE family transcriptional regulator
MPKRKKQQTEAVTLERLSRNPRPSRQLKTLNGKPLIDVPYPLQEVRREVGMSQWELSNASGVPRSAIANIELGRYALSALDGIKLFMTLSRTASPRSAERKKAKESAQVLADRQEELSRKALAAVECQIEALKERREKHKRIAADIESIKAQLREP